MSAIILIPALVSIVALFYWPPAKVFRNVTLPVVLLCPNYYFWKVTLLPPFDFADAVLLPLGIALCFGSLRRWRFSVMDLWVAFFFLSSGMSDRLSGAGTSSTFEFFDALCRAVIPYMIGKTLLEAEGERRAVLKRIVLLMFGGAVIGSYEFFGKADPFRVIFDPFFAGESFAWVTQIRYGFGRASGPFTDAEINGIMLCFGILAAMWLARYENWGRRFRRVTWIPWRKSSLIGGTLFLGLLMTQSRGPELGLLFALPVALVGRSKRVLRNTILVGTVLIVGGVSAYFALSQYSATRAPSSDEQQTAIYRALLIENYLPMALHDGAFGYGPDFPRLGERDSLTGVQDSIDNEYLLLGLTQGYVGFTSFILVCLGTVGTLFWSAIYGGEKADRAFAFTLLGIFVGGLFTIATVYLGFQTYIFFFMMAGWAEAIKIQRRVARQQTFEKVFS